MIKLFKKKTPLQKLEKQYDKLIQESYKMSTIDRAKSDTLAYEANEVLEQIKKIDQNKDESRDNSEITKG
tara:strand:+ start:307 stop:516 length:210 start_codon:yes stop_codon:yes gene_type:complete